MHVLFRVSGLGCPSLEHGQKPAKGKVGTCIAERALTTTAPVLQRKRNYNCYDRSSIANSTTAPLLQREGNCNYHDRSNVAESETATTTTTPVLQRKKL